MKKLLLAFCLLMLPLGVIASDQYPLSGLGDEAKAKIMLEIAKAKSAEHGKATAEQINEYTEVGQNVAKAIIAVAGELGQTVDQVLETTTGKVIIALVVWKVIGPELFGILAAFFWSLTMVPAWMYYFRKFCVNYDYSYHENGKVSKKTRKKADEGAVAIFIIAALVIVVVGVIMAF